MRLPLAVLFAVGLAVMASGCQSNTHLVESELRARENDLRMLRDELDRCDTYNRTLQLELRASRGEAFGPGVPDGPISLYPIRSLTLGRQTGGRELEGVSGDGALQVVLEPRDAENQSIKVPGAVIINVVEVTSEGMKRPMSSWEFSPDDLRNTWKSGLLTTGYVLLLPWKQTPTTEKMRVVVQFRLSDGRVFEAEKDVTIRLPKGTPRRPMGPEPLFEGPVLPLPRKVEPAAFIGRPQPVSP